MVEKRKKPPKLDTSKSESESEDDEKEKEKEQEKSKSAESQEDSGKEKKKESPETLFDKCLAKLTAGPTTAKGEQTILINA